MKVVVDTNVLIAAFLTGGTSQKVLDDLLRRRVCVLSDFILQEFTRVLLSEKFGFPAASVKIYGDFLRRFASLEEEGEVRSFPIQDKDDEHVLSLCHSVQADFLMTGDQELLALKQTGKTRIISPSDYWKILGF